MRKIFLNTIDKEMFLSFIRAFFLQLITFILLIAQVKGQNFPDQKVSSQSYGIFRGIVCDSLTSEILPYANVFIPELKIGVSANNHGFFIIPYIPANKAYKIIVTFVGYAPKELTEFINENKISNIEIYLTKSAIEIDNVLVVGEGVNEVDITALRISIKDIENMTHGVETDIMRSIQFLPGVQSGGDVSARYYVRGGASNENLVLLNDTPIYNPFHALGMFSVIDPDMITGIEFYKGGFGARYDGRLSSVLDIITKDGNKNKFGAAFAASQLTVKSVLEGPIPHGSFIINGRKSYSNKILKKFTNNRNIPIDFYDASFKVNYSNSVFLPISKFTFFGFISNDEIDFKDKLHADFNWSNSHVGFNWLMASHNSPLFAKLTFYYSNFMGGEIPNSSNSRYIKNEVDDISFKMDFNYVLSDRNEFYGGIKINSIKNRLLLSNSSGKLKDVGTEGNIYSSYGGYKLLNINKLKAAISSRLNVLKLAETISFFFEPRINVNYSLLPVLNLKAAWGIYQQELVTISDEDEVFALFEPWIIIPEYLKTPNCVHYIGGFDYYLTEKLKINIEGYYKEMNNLAAINDEIIYPTDNQLIKASGKSHGTEFTMHYKTGWINAQLSYSYSWTTKKIREFEYHPRYDSRHAVKIFVNCELGNNLKVGLSWNYNSGMPFTQMLGYYNKFSPTDIYNPSSLLTEYAHFSILADRNTASLPDYHRLDLNLSKKIELGFMDFSIELNLTNVYDRKNFFYLDTNTGERVNMLPFLPSIDVRAEL